jgi:hypothetical protein
MPLGKGVRYRWIKRGGKKIRLAFKGNEVVEVKKKGSKAKRVKRSKKKR